MQPKQREIQYFSWVLSGLSEIKLNADEDLSTMSASSGGPTRYYCGALVLCYYDFIIIDIIHLLKVKEVDSNVLRRAMSEYELSLTLLVM